MPVVIKADGLAAGKGVTVALTRSQAEEAIAAIFAEPGGSAVIEEFLDGEEVSLFVLTDGTALVPFGTAQDHKRVGDGDTGPNTGGMGAYSPAPVLTPALEQEAIRTIVAPTVATLMAEGTPYSGVLYAGLMLTARGPRLIEYNARFGDPEAEVLMARLDDDLLDLLLATAQGSAGGSCRAAFLERNAALTVVIATEGYPGAPRTGATITGVERAEATGALGLPRRHPEGRRRPAGGKRRPGAGGDRAPAPAWPPHATSPIARSTAIALDGRVPPPRHRLARAGAAKCARKQ